MTYNVKIDSFKYGLALLQNEGQQLDNLTISVKGSATEIACTTVFIGGRLYF